MKIFRNIIVCIFISLTFYEAEGQALNEDTLQYVQSLAYAKQYDKALMLLKKYRNNHADNITALRLNLTILYWKNNIALADQAYKEALLRYPNEQGIRLDYAKMLFDLNRTMEAKILLIEVTKKDSINLEAKNILGTIYYWQDEPYKAQQLFQEVMTKNPTDKTASYYLSEIRLQTAAYITVRSGYYWDQQPLKKLFSVIEYGKYKSKYINPYLRIQPNMFLNQGNAWNISAGNQTNISAIGLKINVYTGISTFAGTTKWMGGMFLTKKINNVINLTVSADHKPYFYTLSSLSKDRVTETIYAGNMTWGKEQRKENRSFLKPQNWNAETGVQAERFFDNNTIICGYGWLLTPTMYLPKTMIRVGYSYSYTNAQELRYSSLYTTEQLIANWNPNAKIEGIYSPYFTPIDQQIHALIGSVTYKGINKVTFTLKGNIGIYASAQAPYLYLENGINNTVIFKQGQAYQKYTPYELNITGQYSVSPNVSIEAKYVKSRAFFFDSQSINVGLKYVLGHE